MDKRSYRRPTAVQQLEWSLTHPDSFRTIVRACWAEAFGHERLAMARARQRISLAMAVRMPTIAAQK